MNPNPLQAFYRKPKFTITLPSRGDWYPKNNLAEKQGEVSVYAMTASDETRFKTNEILLSKTATSSLIQSCVPEITDPLSMPVVDLDVVLLNIRRATYGDTITVSAPVPNTTLTGSWQFSIAAITQEFPCVRDTWVREFTLGEDPETALILEIQPLTLNSLFDFTTQLLRQQQNTQEITQSQTDAAEKIQNLDQQLLGLGSLSVNMLADHVRVIKNSQGFRVDRPRDIRAFLNNIDLEHFQAIQKFTEAQRSAVGFPAQTVHADAEQLAQGAPASWSVPLEFNITNFFN